MYLLQLIIKNVNLTHFTDNGLIVCKSAHGVPPSTKGDCYASSYPMLKRIACFRLSWWSGYWSDNCYRSG